MSPIVSAAASPLTLITPTIAAAQLLTLNATPIQLVPAPGAGRVLVVTSAWAVYRFNTTPYTVANNLLLLGPGATAAISNDQLLWTLTNDSHFMGAAADAMAGLEPQGNLGAPLTDFVNKPLNFGTDAVIADGDGTVDLTVFYYRLTI